MRVVVMGTGPFAVPMFESILHSRHDVATLVTQPLRGGKGAAPVAPMRDAAITSKVRVFDPEDANLPDAIAEIRRAAPDVLVVADYGQILSPELLATAKHGGVNLHGSLLPKYRGAAPINWAIYHGETMTGVSVIQMSPRVDGGGVILQSETPIGADEGAIALEARLAKLGAPLVLDVLDRIEAGTAKAIPQDPSLASRARRLRKSDGEIDWSRTAREIYNQKRAFEPWPGVFTAWKRGGEELRLILGRVRVVEGETTRDAGEVMEAGKGSLIVVTGEGALAINEIQPAGKKMMPVDAFLRGYPVAPGDRFGLKD